jgi:hypothetical protein
MSCCSMFLSLPPDDKMVEFHASTPARVWWPPIFLIRLQRELSQICKSVLESVIFFDTEDYTYLRVFTETLS